MREPDVSTLMNLGFSKKRRKRSFEDPFEEDNEDDPFSEFDNSEWDEFADPEFNISSLGGNYMDIGKGNKNVFSNHQIGSS